MTQVNSVVKGLVDDLIPEVWVAGEVSDLSRPRSGHIYFSLKDDSSNVRAVMWRNSAARLKFELKDGQQVVGFGKIDVYVPRGSYQIVFQQLQPQGEGALQLALRQLHAKFESEGLFAADRKQPLPQFPQRIGFVTSPSGAAIRDFLEVLRERWPLVNVLLIPASVQGENAAREIAAGIRLASQIRPPLDVLVVGRGGGSMEDLWCFNEEQVVRAIADCPLPTISAVGHEIDVTLSDLAADVRALTPSDAARRCVPSVDDISQNLVNWENRGSQAVQQMLSRLADRVSSLGDRPVMLRPEEIFTRKGQQLDELNLRLDRSMYQLNDRKKQQLATLAAAVEALSPLAVLARGYSITRDDQTKVIRSVGELTPGQRIETVLRDGSIFSKVTELNA